MSVGWFSSQHKNHRTKQQNHKHPQTPPPSPTELPRLSLPSYPNFLLIISLILLITIPLIGILGLLTYTIIRVNLNKTSLYQTHKLITAGALHLKKENHTEAINAYESALNLYPTANSLNKTLADLYKCIKERPHPKKNHGREYVALPLYTGPGLQRKRRQKKSAQPVPARLRQRHQVS